MNVFHFDHQWWRWKTSFSFPSFGAPRKHPDPPFHEVINYWSFKVLSNVVKGMGEAAKVCIAAELMDARSRIEASNWYPIL